MLQEIGQDQLLFQYYFSTTLASVLGIPSIHVEFDSAEEQDNLVRRGCRLFLLVMMMMILMMIDDDDD